MGVESLYNSSFQGFVVTKTIAGVLMLLFAIGFFFPATRGIFALVPGYTIPPHFYVWNILTSGFFELSFISLMMNLSALLVYGKFLENFWGGKEFTKFIILVNVFSGLATFFLSIFIFMITGSLYVWFEAHPCGFGGVISGFTIALKQLLPEEKIIPAIDFLRGKHTPALSLILSVTFALAGLVPLSSLNFTIFGLLFSWIYLRFYQVRNELVGDMNENFSFASFFPEPIQGPVRTFSTIVFNILVIARLCKPRAVPIPVERPPEPTSIESERRRQRAQQMLDQKLQQMKQYGQTDISSSKSNDGLQLV